jgi:hypothetical protein
MNRNVSSPCCLHVPHRKAVAVLLVFLTLFVSTAIAAPALASLREDPSPSADDASPVGLAGAAFVLAPYHAEVFVVVDGSRALLRAPLLVSRPYRAPPEHIPSRTI